MYHALCQVLISINAHSNFAKGLFLLLYTWKPRLRGFKSLVSKPNYGRAQVYSQMCVEIYLSHTPGQHIFITKIKRPCLPMLYPWPTSPCVFITGNIYNGNASSRSSLQFVFIYSCRVNLAWPPFCHGTCVQSVHSHARCQQMEYLCCLEKVKHNWPS